MYRRLTTADSGAEICHITGPTEVQRCPTPQRDEEEDKRTEEVGYLSSRQARPAADARFCGGRCRHAEMTKRGSQSAGFTIHDRRPANAYFASAISCRGACGISVKALARVESRPARSSATRRIAPVSVASGRAMSMPDDGHVLNPPQRESRAARESHENRASVGAYQRFISMFGAFGGHPRPKKLDHALGERWRPARRA